MSIDQDDDASWKKDDGLRKNLRDFLMIKRLIIIVLVLTVMLPALPHRPAGDANRDNRIDLGDVIVNIRSLSQSAADPRDFREELGKTVTSIRTVAGLDRVFKADDGQARTTSGVGTVYLLSSTDVTPVMTAAPATGNTPDLYQSLETPAEHGPPRYRT